MADTQEVPNLGWDPRILVLRHGPIVDAYIVVTSRFVLLVDTLVSPAAARVQLELAREHLARRSLLVLNTHADWDHVWGNQLYAGPEPELPAPILASRAAAAEFEAPVAEPFLAEMQAKDPKAYGEVVLTPPTLLFDGGLTLDGGDLTIVVIPTPGHAPGHVSVWLPEIETLLAADAAEPPFPFARSARDLPDLRASLGKLAALDPETALYCHAPTDAGPSLIADNLAYFDRVEAACRAAVEAGQAADLPPDADLAALIGCRFSDAVPARWAGPKYQEFHRTEGHPAQLRQMLAWLTGTEAPPPPEPPLG
jgi:glyoxylase-like metal-dependent hydrolase (beta-lactamase superfamily II)